MKKLLIITALISLAIAANVERASSQRGTGVSPRGVKSALFDKDSAMVVLRSGESYTGIVNLPKVNTKSITLKLEKGDDITFDSGDIEYITAWQKGQDPEDNSVKLVYTDVYEYKSFKNDDRSPGKKPIWMMQVIGTGNISAFIQAQQYDLRRDGTIAAISYGAGVPGDAWFYARKPGEDYPTKLAMQPLGAAAGHDKYFREWGQMFFSDYPELVKKIADKEYKTKDFFEAVREYDRWAEGN